MDISFVLKIGIKYRIMNSAQSNVRKIFGGVHFVCFENPRWLTVVIILTPSGSFAYYVVMLVPYFDGFAPCLSAVDETYGEPPNSDMARSQKFVNKTIHLRSDV